MSLKLSDMARSVVPFSIELRRAPSHLYAYLCNYVGVS